MLALLASVNSLHCAPLSTDLWIWTRLILQQKHYPAPLPSPNDATPQFTDASSSTCMFALNCPSCDILSLPTVSSHSSQHSLRILRSQHAQNYCPRLSNVTTRLFSAASAPFSTLPAPKPVCCGLLTWSFDFVVSAPSLRWLPTVFALQKTRRHRSSVQNAT